MNEPIVIVPTFQREELLFLCLEAIRRESPEIGIRVYSDRGAWTKDLQNVCIQFEASRIVQAPHNFYGNSWNVIDAAKDALKFKPSIVHVVEDDVVLHRGYLKWAENMIGKGDPVACARIASPILRYFYDAPAASWDSEGLRTCLSMLPTDYFSNSRELMVKALDAKFPKSIYRGGSGEQDGFFFRCLEKLRWTTAFPPKPYATHIGAAGYNRGGAKRPEGNLEERIAWYRALLKDRVRRIALFGLSITQAEMSGWNGET